MVLVFAALYAGLLGLSFGRGVRHLRRVSKNLPALQETDDEWRRRALDVVFVGAGDVTLGAKIGRDACLSQALVLRVTNGMDIAVPTGTYIEIATQAIRRVGLKFVVPRDLALTAYISSYIPGEDVMRAAWQLPPHTKVILVDRGAAPIAEVIARFERSWRPGRVAWFVTVSAALVAGVAASPAAAWLAALGAIVLAADYAFFHSAIVMLNCTEQGLLPPAGHRES